MTAACPAGAVSRPVTDWHAIPWRKVYREVRRLQARIVQAVQAGRWGKVKALQRLLARSFSARALAVRRVTEATGRRTPGVDGETWDTPASRAAAILRLRQRGYRPKPLRRIYIPKKKNKLRPLGIPAMIDRAQQALHLLTLDPVAETTADPNSYGFRKERSPADAIAQCFITLAKRHAPEWILEGDIKACFDTISHAWLERHIPMDRTILHQWLKAGYLERHTFHPTTAGTPQGGPISPVLANLTLDGLERLLTERYPKLTRAGKRAKVNFVRFADDFIVTSSSKERLEHEVKPLIMAFLAKRGLELSAEKTHITHINDGFDFLGQNRTQVLRQTAHHPVQAEHRRLSDEGSGAHHHAPTNPSRRADPSTQSRHPRLGELPSPCGQQAHLQRHRPRDLSSPLALGQTASPEQVRRLA
jgi:RNA-directed DNA polymerase